MQYTIIIDLPTSDQSGGPNAEVSANNEWGDFVIFKDDPTWGRLFAEIEESRNQSLTAE